MLTRYEFGNLRLYSSGYVGSEVSEEVRLALQGKLEVDGSWIFGVQEGSSRNNMCTSDQAQIFMENTHQQATIMCDMLDKLKDKLAGIIDSPRISRGLDIIKPSFLALQGYQCDNGDWAHIEGSNCYVLPAESAAEFMELTHKDSSLMCDMLDKYNNNKIQVMDENSSLNSAGQGSVYKNVASDGMPSFQPSEAVKPTKFHHRTDDLMQDIIDCLAKPSCIQSFFSDLSLAFGGQSDTIAIRDEILHVPPFDESLYCELVIESHRFSLAELYDKHQEEMKKRSDKWFKYGIFASIVTFNPMLPFFLGNQARMSSDRGKKLEEIIPNPNLLFRQDQHSFLSMVKAGASMPRMRRLIINPVLSDSLLYLQVLPAVITQDSVIPMQVFKYSDNYFVRPICAGINHQQDHYNARKLHRLYSHLRADGGYVDTGMRINVQGQDIEQQKYKLYKFSCDTRELEYYYIDYATEPWHIF